MLAHTQRLKWHAVIVATWAENNDLVVANIINVARSFVLKVRIELKAFGGNISTVSGRKKF